MAEAQAGAIPCTLGRRLGAWALDGLIINVVSLVGLIPIWLAAVADSDSALVAALVVYLLALTSFVLYNGWWLVGRTGATLGKRAIGISVVDHVSGAPIGLGRAFVRALLGFLAWTALFNSERRGVHDLAAGSFVVDALPKSAAGRPLGEVTAREPIEFGLHHGLGLGGFTLFGLYLLLVGPAQQTGLAYLVLPFALALLAAGYVSAPKPA